MPSRKKDRGKQRKAAKQNRDVLACGPPAGIVDLVVEGCRVIRHDDGTTRIRHPCFKHIKGNTGAASASAVRKFDRGLLNDEERQELAENYALNFGQAVQEGNFHGTHIIMRNITDRHIGDNLKHELLKADIHLSLLRFLNQSDKSISGVLGRVVDAGESIKVPQYWMHILGLLVQDEFSSDARVALAEGIGPFVTVMMDEKREMFQSNMIWHVCLPPFFQLARCIMESREAFSLLISYEGFLPFVAQASCWSQSREDIVEEYRMLHQRHAPEARNCLSPFSKVCIEAQKAIGSIFLRHNDVVGGEDMRGALDQIACTPLLSDDPNCNDSTMAGLIRMLDESSNRCFYFDCLIQPLLLTHGYVDARVISELIEYGKRDPSIEATEFVLSTMVAILGRDDNYEHINRIDSRCAAAVRCGLMEFCIDALVAYGDGSGYQIGENIYFIAHGLCSMAMHSKTSRALRERKEGIVTGLEALWKKVGSQFDDTCNLIGASIDMSAPATCCNCLKEVDRNELLYCKRCGVECYCSPACQKESYALGHDEKCKVEVEFTDALREVGLSETELKRWRVLSSNLMMNGCRLVRKKAAEILDEEHQDVVIDFEHSPPVVEVFRNDEDEDPGSLKCIFAVPVCYGFAEKAGQEEVALEKFISRRSLALHVVAGTAKGGGAGIGGAKGGNVWDLMADTRPIPSATDATGGAENIPSDREVWDFMADSRPSPQQGCD